MSMKIIQKKHEILDYLFESLDSENYRKLSIMLNELISLCKINEVKQRGVAFIGSDCDTFDLVKLIHNLETIKDKVIIVCDDNTKIPENRLLKNESVFEFKSQPIPNIDFIDYDKKNNEPWYRKFENKKRRKY